MLSLELWSAVFAIVVIDIVLAGDNAIVIGLAARNLPKTQQKKAILLGTFGAVAIRICATVFVVWLLKVPGLLLAGSLMLIYIGIKLLTDKNEKTATTVAAKSNLLGAVKTIIIADACMGLDNVLGVAGAAQGNFMLVVLGLTISIPIVVFSSALVIKLVDRFPAIIDLGAVILGWTAAKMAVSEPLLAPWLTASYAKWLLTIVIIGIILGTAAYKKRLPAGGKLPHSRCES
ncbi:MAG: TerC family protein [Sporomusaceae bacterium]|nr:TerC family protein [Sporomusaceae bacterium]